MGSDLYLSYSGRRIYLICPRRYKFQYIDHVPFTVNPKDVLFGSIIGKVFEWFYERQVWLSEDVYAAVESLVEPAIRFAVSERKFNLVDDPEFARELKTDLGKFVPAGINSIKRHKLLSFNSRAEVKLHTTYYHPEYKFMLRLGGYADFIHIDGQQVWIIDGKGSKHRERYVDPEQLIWYAVLFYLKFHIAPVRLGFVYWRFPEDALQWVMYDEHSIRNNLNETFRVAKKIKLGVFDSNPSKECYRCPYSDDCKEGKQYMAVRRIESGNRIKDSMFGLEIL